MRVIAIANDGVQKRTQDNHSAFNEEKYPEKSVPKYFERLKAAAAAMFGASASEPGRSPPWSTRLHHRFAAGWSLPHSSPEPHLSADRSEQTEPAGGPASSLPSMVRCRRRGARSNRQIPSAASNCLICRLKAGCAMWSVLAACRKLPARAISAKDTNCRRSKE